MLDFAYNISAIEDQMIATIKAGIGAGVSPQGYVHTIASYGGQLTSTRTDELKSALQELAPAFPLVLVSYSEGEDVMDPPVSDVMQEPVLYRHNAVFVVVVIDNDPRGDLTRRKGSKVHPGVYKMLSDVRALIGGLQYVQPIVTPDAPTVAARGVTGATSYSYFIVARDADGRRTLPSPAAIVEDGNAALSVANFNEIAWEDRPGVFEWDVLRGSTSQKVATVRAPVFKDFYASTRPYIPATLAETAERQPRALLNNQPFRFAGVQNIRRMKTVTAYAQFFETFFRFEASDRRAAPVAVTQIIVEEPTLLSGPRPDSGDVPGVIVTESEGEFIYALD